MHSQGYTNVLEPFTFSPHTKNKQLNSFVTRFPCFTPAHVHTCYGNTNGINAVHRHLQYGQLFENCEKCNLNLHVKMSRSFSLGFFMRFSIDSFSTHSLNKPKMLSNFQWTRGQCFCFFFLIYGYFSKSLINCHRFHIMNSFTLQLRVHNSINWKRENYAQTTNYPVLFFSQRYFYWPMMIFFTVGIYFATLSQGDQVVTLLKKLACYT